MVDTKQNRERLIYENSNICRSVSSIRLHIAAGNLRRAAAGRGFLEHAGYSALGKRPAAVPAGAAHTPLVCRPDQSHECALLVFRVAVVFYIHFAAADRNDFNPAGPFALRYRLRLVVRAVSLTAI